MQVDHDLIGKPNIDFFIVDFDGLKVRFVDIFFFLECETVIFKFF